MNKGLQAIFFVRKMYLSYITVNRLCYSFEVCIQVGKNLELNLDLHNKLGNYFPNKIRKAATGYLLQDIMNC